MQGETREALPPPSKVKKGVFGIIVYRLFFFSSHDSVFASYRDGGIGVFSKTEKL